MKRLLLFLSIIFIIGYNVCSQVIYTDSSGYSYDASMCISSSWTLQTSVSNASWISPDGLSIYYNGQILEPATLMYHAERKSITENFKNLSLNFLPVNSDCPWLTDDELNIFYTHNGTLFHAKRSSRLDDFSDSTRIILKGINKYIYDASFTQDLSRLYIPGMIDSNSCIRILQKVTSNEYELIDSINFSRGYLVTSGQISKNGLKYFVSLYDSTDHEYIYYLKRGNLNEKFDSLTFIDNRIINDSNEYNSQPSPSDNEKFMMFVTRPRGILLEITSYLNIAFNHTTNIDDEQTNISEILIISPNPATDFIEISVRANDRSPLQSDVKIYDIFGQTVLSVGAIHELPLRVNVSGLVPGMYFVRIGDKGIKVIKL